jgi:hypothetical protein
MHEKKPGGRGQNAVYEWHKSVTVAERVAFPRNGSADITAEDIPIMAVGAAEDQIRMVGRSSG